MCAPCSGPKIDRRRALAWTLPSSRPSALLYLFVLPASQEWGGDGDCPVLCVCVCVYGYIYPTGCFKNVCSRSADYTRCQVVTAATDQMTVFIWICAPCNGCVSTFRSNIMPPPSKWSLCTTDIFSWSIQHPLEPTATLKKQAVYPSETWQHLTSTRYKNPNQDHSVKNCTWYLKFLSRSILRLRHSEMWRREVWQTQCIQTSRTKRLPLSSGQKGRPKDRNRGYERTHSPGGPNHLARWSSEAW